MSATSSWSHGSAATRSQPSSRRSVSVSSTNGGGLGRTTHRSVREGTSSYCQRMAPEYPESGRSTHGEPAKVAAANTPERTASYAHSPLLEPRSAASHSYPHDGHPAGGGLRSGSCIGRRRF